MFMSRNLSSLRSVCSIVNFKLPDYYWKISKFSSSQMQFIIAKQSSAYLSIFFDRWLIQHLFFNPLS